MVSRRILIKSLSFFSGTALLTGLPVATIRAQSSPSRLIKSGGKSQKIVILGHTQGCKPLLKYAVQHPEHISITGIAGTIGEETRELVQQLNIAPQVCFDTFEQFLQSGIPADVVFIAGEKKVQETALQAIKSGYHVWTDRPVAFEPAQCKKINGFAAGYFCKVHIAYVIDDAICLMENKTYNAKS